MLKIKTLFNVDHLIYNYSRNNIDKLTKVSVLNNNIIFLSKMPTEKLFILHRRNLPAFIGISMRSWYRKHELHNLHGPAYIGNPIGNSGYYINGTNHTQTEWEVERLKYLTT